MSRIGQKPIPVPDKVKIAVNGPLVNIEGPRGKLKHTLPAGIEARFDAGGQCVLELAARSVDVDERSVDGDFHLVGDCYGFLADARHMILPVVLDSSKR